MTWPTQPGGRETTIVSDVTEVRIPWRVFKFSILVDTLRALALYLIVMVILCMVIMIPEYFVSYDTHRTFWGSVWSSLVTTYEIGRWFLFLPVVYSLYSVIKHGQEVIRYRWIPEQRDRNYPAQYKARDMETAGLHYWDLVEIQKNLRGRPEPPSLPVETTIQRDNGRVSIKRRPIPVPSKGRDALLSYLHSIIGRTATLSVRGGKHHKGAVDFGYIIPRELDDLKAWFVDHEMGYEDPNREGHVILKVAGYHWIRTFLEENGVKLIPVEEEV